MLKIGVLGAGHLGKIHIRLLLELKDRYRLVGIFDPDPEKVKGVRSEMDTEVRAFSSMEELVKEVDVVDIVTPTLDHYECAAFALKHSRHVFVEKPMTRTPEEARSLVRLTEESNMKLQVGHVERYNPAFKTALPYLQRPMFIESHRLAPFNPRGTDVPVVLDLMVHDIDIVLSVVNSNVQRVQASGVAVISDSPDIANARIEFASGAVANLTASRISMKEMRRSRFFQKDAYIAVDMLEKELEVVRVREPEGELNPFAMTLKDNKSGREKEVSYNKPDIATNNPIREELASFADAIEGKREPDVTVQDGYRALDVAHRVTESVRATSGLIEDLGDDGQDAS
jgi:predicted dehydrogenase